MAEQIHICAIAKNEGLYIQEWIHFHLLVGVSHLTIYDNNSDDDTAVLLKPFVDSGLLTCVPWPMQNPSQAAAYSDYIQRNRGPWWAAFIDCDEFLWAPQHDSLPLAIESLLATGVSRSAFGINWMVFGSGGQTEYEDKPVIERFTWRPATSHPVDQHIKSVVWMDQQVSVGSDPHFFHVQNGTFDENGNPIRGPYSSHSSRVLRINHYSSKSLAEWRKRILLGKPDRSGVEVREQEWYWDRQAMDVDDREIQRYLPQLKERLIK